MPKRTYEQAAHAMQTGVAHLMQRDPSETAPKHLRVGVNSALVDSAALASLLIQKGIIGREEYLEALAVAMNDEADRYQQRVNEAYGGEGRITLH